MSHIFKKGVCKQTEGFPYHVRDYLKIFVFKHLSKLNIVRGKKNLPAIAAFKSNKIRCRFDFTWRKE